MKVLKSFKQIEKNVQLFFIKILIVLKIHTTQTIGKNY